jgi:hypothetical protein
MVVGLSFRKDTGVRNWLSTVREVYMHHASNRVAFTLMEPRPALIEGRLVNRKNVTVEYLKHDSICLDSNGTGGLLDPKHCHEVPKEQMFLNLTCLGDVPIDVSICGMIEEPEAWKHRMNRDVSYFSNII